MMDERTLVSVLGWLADAPLFIDADQVGRFYDAVARPEGRRGKVVVRTGKSQGRETGVSGEVSGELSLGGSIGGVLKMLFGGMEGTATVGATGGSSASSSTGTSEDETIELHPISNPERQLIQLVIHYLDKQQSRLRYATLDASLGWSEPSFIGETPRALLFLNLPGQDEAHRNGTPETKLIPAAAEFANGEVVPLYKMLEFDGGAPPDYPESRPGTTPEDLRAARKRYWQWFDQNYSATKAMLAVENASKDRGRIRWIAYRLPLTTEGDTLHLHLRPGEQYDTGDFAYNFVKRGHKHGLRLVGTLKSEPDMNVLAVYEK